MSPAYNAFAYECWGIQTYFTAPVKFEDIFLANNLLSVVIMTLEVAICLSILARRIGPPSAPILAATIGALIFTVAGQLPIANWASLKFPRKLEFGSMRSQRNSGAAIWILLAVQIVVGGFSSSIIWFARWTGNLWLPAELFAFIAIVGSAGYFASLPAPGELAQKRKENLIEALCR